MQRRRARVRCEAGAASGGHQIGEYSAAEQQQRKVSDTAVGWVPSAAGDAGDAEERVGEIREVAEGVGCSVDSVCLQRHQGSHVRTHNSFVNFCLVQIVVER